MSLAVLINWMSNSFVDIDFPTGFLSCLTFAYTLLPKTLTNAKCTYSQPYKITLAQFKRRGFRLLNDIRNH